MPRRVLHRRSAELILRYEHDQARFDFEVVWLDGWPGKVGGGTKLWLDEVI